MIIVYYVSHQSLDWLFRHYIASLRHSSDILITNRKSQCMLFRNSGNENDHMRLIH
jgi:hypothetical protein